MIQTRFLPARTLDNFVAYCIRRNEYIPVRVHATLVTTTMLLGYTSPALVNQLLPLVTQSLLKYYYYYYYHSLCNRLVIQHHL